MVGGAADGGAATIAAPRSSGPIVLRGPDLRALRMGPVVAVAVGP
jgi:hypothetical protein